MITVWWADVGMTVTVAKMMMMMMTMIAVSLLLTNPFILCSSHPQLCYFRSQIVEHAIRAQKQEGKKQVCSKVDVGLWKIKPKTLVELSLQKLPVDCVVL